MIDRIKIGFEVADQPFPILAGNGNELGVNLAEALMGSAKIDPASHHPDTGAMPQNIFGILRAVPAHHGDPPGHEFSEIVAH